ncbi:MAG: sn-glycerol-3-phosphate ABC transporter ATP-binding protein UgpC [Defluviitaleaceae bacterium]|nr:sn-glycerol-3-phosphate ABC transporter ATP-binding protein UgpC [Defluviitaleaceae bacterium]
MADLSLKNLNKIYDNGVQAVFDFNLDIKDGEFIVLVGPSGCGKTTTLRMVAGLEDITSGTLTIDGTDMTNEAPKNRDIAMVFQNYALYAHMTVYENMAFSLMLRREDEDVIHKKVIAAAEVLGLQHQLGKKPKQLSGGQMQRVALGRTIVREPKVFLFDEPLSNLDAKLRGSTRRELKLLHNKLGATIIYVTHDQIEALTLADRIICMSMGYVQQVGTPTELYDTPANLFVASFIGLPPMNFFDVLVKDENTLCFGSSELKLSKEDAELIKNYVGKEMVLGVRPEDIYPSETGIPLTVDINENLGYYTLVHGILEGKKITAKIKSWCNYKQGDVINVDFADGKTHFFDKETTMSLKYLQGRANS